MRNYRSFYVTFLCIVGLVSILSVGASAYVASDQTPLPYYPNGFYLDAVPSDSFGNYIRYRVSSYSMLRCSETNARYTGTRWEVTYKVEVYSSRLWGENQRIYIPWTFAEHDDSITYEVLTMKYPYVIEMYLDPAMYTVNLSQTNTYPVQPRVNKNANLGVLAVNITYNGTDTDPPEEYILAGVVQFKLFLEEKVATLPDPPVVHIGDNIILGSIRETNVIGNYLMNTDPFFAPIFSGMVVVFACYCLLKTIK